MQFPADRHLSLARPAALAAQRAKEAPAAQILSTLGVSLGDATALPSGYARDVVTVGQGAPQRSDLEPCAVRTALRGL